MVPIWSPPCQPYHTVQRYTIATQKPICAPYHTRACSPQCHTYRTSTHPNNIIPYVELCTTSNPGHHHHLTKLALCLTSYDAASPAQRSVSKSTLCRPVVRYHVFVILHRLSNSFCDNGNKRFFEVDLPIDVLSPACEQKRAAKLEIALDSHLPCHP